MKALLKLETVEVSCFSRSESFSERDQICLSSKYIHSPSEKGFTPKGKNLHTYTVKDLLFGMENLTEQENESLFIQVQD